MISNTLAQNILRLITGKTSSISGGDVYIGLSTTVPTSNMTSGAIENVTEPSAADGYSRELIGTYQTSSTQVFGDVTYDSTNNCFVTSNTKQVKFNKATGAWGTVKAFCLYNSLTGGAPMFYGTLTSEVTVSANQSCNIAVGAAVLKLY